MPHEQFQPDLQRSVTPRMAIVHVVVLACAQLFTLTLAAQESTRNKSKSEIMKVTEIEGISE